VPPDDPAIRSSTSRRGEQQLGRPPPREHGAGLHVEDPVAAVAGDPAGGDVGGVEPLAPHRLHREPPDVGDAHRADGTRRMRHVVACTVGSSCWLTLRPMDEMDEMDETTVTTSDASTEMAEDELLEEELLVEEISIDGMCGVY
jgi:mycofactocin precursor